MADIGVVLEQITIGTTATITPDKAAIFGGTSYKGEVRVTTDERKVTLKTCMK